MDPFTLQLPCEQESAFWRSWLAATIWGDALGALVAVQEAGRRCCAAGLAS